jgi:hypothetical protein
VSASTEAPPLRRPVTRPRWRDLSAAVAAASMLGALWLAPTAGAGGFTVAAEPPSDPPSSVANTALRRAATQLRAAGSLEPVAQRTALADVGMESIRLTLRTAGAEACVEATHDEAPGQVWSYDARTGGIGAAACSAGAP